ncbi:helix-turn-helix domain-containing protein [Streptomyces clavuligerus]|uniref:helix-turn-helix domain-containing protein n=1 Tax=Streptomyces clavuligerus TaxID=1901 RepID=UPI00020D94E4|nr:helix-turn-helix transcriptional regulator [Streptomyces clavuligerus]
MVAAQRDLWRPTEVLAAFQQVGFNPSLSKVAALWGGTPVTVRLDDLDLMCAALDCTVADLLQAEPVAGAQPADDVGEVAVGSEVRPPGLLRPVPRGRHGGGPRSLPPS